MKIFFIAPAIAFSLLTNYCVAQQISASSRHIIILQPSVDGLMGSYLFAAENRNKVDSPAQFPVIFPKEMIDFRPEEGLAAENIILSEGDNSNIQIKKNLKPGSTLLGLSFNVAASDGKSELTFVAPYDVAEFLVMAPQGAIVMSSAQMEGAQAQPFVGRTYDMLRKQEFKKGEEIHVFISGVPEGRKRLWYAGGIAALVLFIGGFGLAYVTRPKDLLEEG